MSLSAPCGHSKKAAICKPGRESSTDTEFTCALTFFLENGIEVTRGKGAFSILGKGVIWASSVAAGKDLCGLGQDPILKQASM